MSKPLRSTGRRVASRPRKVSEKRVLLNKTFRLPADLVRRAEKRAIDEDKTLTQVIQEQLEVWTVGDAWEQVREHAEAFRAAHKDAPEYDWKIDKDELHERD